MRDGDACMMLSLLVLWVGIALVLGMAHEGGGRGLLSYPRARQWATLVVSKRRQPLADLAQGFTFLILYEQKGRVDDEH